MNAVLQVAALLAMASLLSERGLFPTDPWLNLIMAVLAASCGYAFLASMPRTGAGGDLGRSHFGLSAKEAPVPHANPADIEATVIEQLLQDVLTNSLIGAVIQEGSNARIVFANDKAIEMFGFASMEAFQRADIRETYARPEQRDELHKRLYGLGEDGGGASVIGFEVLRRRVDGTAWWAIMNTVALQRRDGGRYWITWLLDITDRKEQEARLRESEEQLRRILDSSPNGVMIEARDGSSVYTNHRALQLFGARTEAEFHARNIADSFVDHADCEALRGALRRSNGSASLEMRRRRLDGSEWWCRIDCVPMKLGSRPVIVHWLYDVTSSRNLHDEVRQNSAILELTLQSMAQAIVMYDSEDRLVIYNDRFARLFEMSESDLDGHPTFDLLIDKLCFDDDWPGFAKVRDRVGNRVKDFELLQSLLAEHGVDIFTWPKERLPGELEARRSAGNVTYERLRRGHTWLEARSNFLADGSVVCTYTDITLRKVIEGRTRESERLLQEIVDAIPIFLSLKDRSFRYLLINQGTADLFGVAKDVPIDARLTDFLDDSWTNAIIEADRRIIDGISSRETFEVSLPHANGERRLMLFNKQPLMDLNNDVYAILSICYDITDIRKTQGALKESEELLRSVINASTAAISVQDSAQRYFFVNDLFLERHKLRREEVLGRTAPEIFGKRLGDIHAELDRTVLADESPVLDFELKDLTRARPRYWLVNKVPIKNAAGEVEKLVTVALEITARKVAEEDALRARDAAERALADLRLTQEHLIQSEKMASLGNLVAVIAHEINTPIGNALLASTHLYGKVEDMLKHAETSPPEDRRFQSFLEVARDTTRLMNTNVKRAAELIRSFKQVAVGQRTNQLRSFAVREYVQGVVDSLNPQLQKSQPTIAIRCSDVLRVRSYPGVISQILSNLIMNSVIHGFGERTGGHIDITVETVGSCELLLQVSDNGRGIPRQVRARIFEPFFTTARGSGSSGLGLHIIYNLVTQVLGGRIELADGTGPGCCVIIAIPVEVRTEG